MLPVPADQLPGGHPGKAQGLCHPLPLPEEGDRGREKRVPPGPLFREREEEGAPVNGEEVARHGAALPLPEKGEAHPLGGAAQPEPVLFAPQEKILLLRGAVRAVGDVKPVRGDLLNHEKPPLFF